MNLDPLAIKSLNGVVDGGWCVGVGGGNARWMKDGKISIVD